MKLYYSPSACSLSPHIVLREIGLNVELVRVDLAKHTLPDGSDFSRINPKGYVPALQLDDGSVLTEGTAIVQYLADLKPDSGLTPQAGSLERYRLQEWLGFINSEIHKGFGPLFKPTTPEDYKATVRQNLAKRFDYLAEHLSTHDFLMGTTFSVVDAYLFTVLNWGPWTGVDLSPWPALVAYQKRIGSRPSVVQAQAAEAAAS